MPLAPHRKEISLREFRLNGFVILRGFLPEELVEGMHRDLEPFLEMEHRRVLQGESRALRGRSRVAFDVRRCAEMMPGSALADDRFQRNEVIEDLVTEIMSPASWRRGWTQVECVWPGSEYMDWHSDQVPADTPDLEAPHETIRVTYNIPLVPFTGSNGAMELLPGSHMQPRAFHAASFREIPHLYPLSLRLRRGDVILRDGNTLHRGTPNRADGPRPMLDQTYKAIPA